MRKKGGIKMQSALGINRKDKFLLVAGLYLGLVAGLALTILITLLGISEIWILIALIIAPIGVIAIIFALKYLLIGLIFVLVKSIKATWSLAKKFW